MGVLIAMPLREHSVTTVASLLVLVSIGCDQSDEATASVGLPTPVLTGGQCEAECLEGVEGVEHRPLSCGCPGAPCEVDLATYLDETACRLDASIAMFACTDQDTQYLRVSSSPSIFVFVFSEGSLIGYQDGEAEPNLCGGGFRKFGELVPAAPCVDDIQCDPCATSLAACLDAARNAPARDPDAGPRID